MCDIPEKDWKKLRAMKDELLQVACGRILNKISRVIEKSNEGNHQTYLTLWKTLREEDREIANMFDDVKRSTAILKLAAWYRNKLIDRETLAQFSEETRASVEFICQL